ncbi:hypothetical protein Hanom_Chr07g00604841 [Helianthus anomalus]
MDGVNESDENGKISNILNLDVEKQTLGRKSQNWPKLRDENGIYSFKKGRQIFIVKPAWNVHVVVAPAEYYAE